MSKPLTIDELKALQVGDWVWLERVSEEEIPAQLYDEQFYYRVAAVGDDYKEKFFEAVGGELRHRAILNYEDYGKTWLAYKNKEQAEAIEERFTHEDSTYYEKALVRLQELENKIAKGEIVELPCKIGDPIWVVYRDFDHRFNEYKIYESTCTGFAFEHGTEIRIVTAFCCYDFDRVSNFTDKSEAEQRLAELRGEK